MSRKNQPSRVVAAQPQRIGKTRLHHQNRKACPIRRQAVFAKPQTDEFWKPRTKKQAHEFLFQKPLGAAARATNITPKKLQSALGGKERGEGTGKITISPFLPFMIQNLNYTKKNDNKNTHYYGGYTLFSNNSNDNK